MLFLVVNMKKLSLSLFILMIASVLFACGGGGGSSASTPANGFSQSYTTSAGIGELMTYSINTTNKTYAYTITQSSYGLTGLTGSGTLTANSDGSFSPSESPNSRVYALQNGLLVGAVSLNLSGTSVNVPVVGIASPITSLANLAGTYNYISKNCVTASHNCQPTTSYGTIKIDATGNYTECASTDITASPSCSDSAGTISATTTSGVWSYVRTGGTNTNYLLAFKAPNGQNVLIIDFNDLGGYGYGQAIASTQSSVQSGSVDGTYTYLANTGVSGATSVAGTGFTSVYTFNGSSGTNSGTVVFNSPWTGMSSVTGGNNTGIAMMAGTGVYAYRDNDATHHYFEIGMRH